VQLDAVTVLTTSK